MEQPHSIPGQPKPQQTELRLFGCLRAYDRCSALPRQQPCGLAAPMCAGAHIGEPVDMRGCESSSRGAYPVRRPVVNVPLMGRGSGFKGWSPGSLLDALHGRLICVGHAPQPDSRQVVSNLVLTLTAVLTVDKPAVQRRQARA